MVNFGSMTVQFIICMQVAAIHTITYNNCIKTSNERVQRTWNITWMPRNGCVVSPTIGQWTYAGERVKQYLRRIIERAVLSSSVAKFMPTQVRDPKPKRRNAAEFKPVTFSTPPENLSGLKSCMSSPHISGSLWSFKLAMKISIPAGRTSLPCVDSRDTVLVIPTTGVYNLMDSFTIIVTCKQK